jgi:hypothetical protein
LQGYAIPCFNLCWEITFLRQNQEHLWKRYHDASTSMQVGVNETLPERLITSGTGHTTWRRKVKRNNFCEGAYIFQTLHGQRACPAVHVAGLLVSDPKAEELTGGSVGRDLAEQG